MEESEPSQAAPQLQESHLYPGFRHVGQLPSIAWQRRRQGEIIAAHAPGNLLVVGCGYGDELREMLELWTASLAQLQVVAIDLADVQDDVTAEARALGFGDRFTFQRLNLVDASQLHLFGCFDFVQCGFVLHDFAAAEKNRAVTGLASALRPGGTLLISDIFQEPEVSASGIYARFIAEAGQAYSDGLLTASQHAALLGGGEQPGLLSTQADAAQGSRDYFDTRAAFMARADECEIEAVALEPNPLNDSLALAILRQPSKA